MYKLTRSKKLIGSYLRSLKEYKAIIKTITPKIFMQILYSLLPFTKGKD